MPTVDIFNVDNKKVGTLDLSDDVFGEQTREDLIWEVVRCQMARMRQGTANTKTRAEVSGTGAKPFRQKRTGRARQGTKRAPHHRGGGTAFGPHFRSYAYQVPKKVRKKALRSFLSSQVRDNKLIVLKDFELAEVKTKRLANLLDQFGHKKALLVDSKNMNLKLSARNLPYFSYRPVEGINLVEAVKYEAMLITESSIKKLEGVLAL
jgi:large subunit ribosomal protein L4